MTIPRWMTVVIGFGLLILIGAYAVSTVAADADRRPDATAAVASDTTIAGGDSEPTLTPERLGRAVAGFALIVGWSVGIVATIVRAQSRSRSRDQLPSRQAEVSDGASEPIDRRPSART